MRRTDARNSLNGICRITDGCQCLAVAGEGAAFGEEIQEAVFEGLIAEALHEIDAVGGTLAGEVFDKGIEALDVALDIALGEPEAAGFAGFDLGEFDFAFEVGLPILGVEDVKEVGLPRPCCGAGDGGLGAGGIPTKKIGDDEDDAVALPRGMEVAKAAVEIRDAIKFDATDGLQDLFNIALPAQGGELLADGIAEGVEADALLIAEAEVGERNGEAECLTALLWEGGCHAGAGIDEDLEVQLLGLFVEADEELIQPGIEPPIDGAVVFSGGVVTVVFELPGKAGGWGGLGPATQELAALAEAQG